MFFSPSTALLAATGLILPLVSAVPAAAHHESAKRCSFGMKKAGIQREIDTISSHSFADANLIPLAPTASRTFFVTPNEFPEITLEVNVGIDATTVRTELVALGTFLDAGVPKKSVHYIKNANGTVTSDFIQTDRIALPRVNVREIHEFDSACQITKIIGFVHGNLICPVDLSTITNSVIADLCTQLVGLGLIGDLQPIIKSPLSGGTGILK